MKTRTLQVFCLLLLATLLLNAVQGAPSASPPQYTVVDIGTADSHSPDDLPAGARAINNLGWVTGETKDGAVFLWRNGQMTSLGMLPTSGSDSDEAVGCAINDSGQIVGASGGFNPLSMSGLVNCYALLYDHGKLKSLDNPMGEGSFEALGMNNQGEVVGLYAFRGFYWSKGKHITLRTLSTQPSGNSSRVTAINSRSQFVGATTVNKPNAYPLPIHAFLWVGDKRRGHMRDLGVLPGYRNSYAAAINDTDEIVGFTGSDGNFTHGGINADGHAFVWEAGRMRDLGALPGEKTSSAYGINDAGVIVGQSGKRAVVWIGGQIYDLDTLAALPANAQLTIGVGINRSGQIVCNGAIAGTAHAFLLTPQKP